MSDTDQDGRTARNSPSVAVNINIDYAAPPPSYESVVAGTARAYSCTTCTLCHETIPLNEIRHSERCSANRPPSMHNFENRIPGRGTRYDFNERGTLPGVSMSVSPRRNFEDSDSRTFSYDEACEMDLNTRPSSHLCFSIMVCLCCNPVCGFIAVGYSSMASEDKARGDYEAASKHAVKACWFNITGIFITLCVLGAVLAALYLS